MFFRLPNIEISFSPESTLTGLVYVFNLIVGTGALALPKAFSTTGWGLGLGVILMLAFMSYLTVTLMIEAMSIANALLVKSASKKRGSLDLSDSSVDQIKNGSNLFPRDSRERDPLLPAAGQIQRHANNAGNFEIKERVEMGRMASMFFGRTGVYLFYLCLAVYLYGDLAIYIAAVSKSLRDVACTYTDRSYWNESNEIDDLVIQQDSDPCWEGSWDRFTVYRFFSVAFILILGPFAFFNVQKTKYLQLSTTFMRWLAFAIMITLAVVKILHGEGPQNLRPIATVSALPNLFGVCVYAFMCHHSLPSLVTPIACKKHLFQLFTFDYILITSFYLLLAFTGIFAFKNIKDLYTLNFEPDSASDFLMTIIQYFLSLFPVFTLSTNFPIIAITLKNNLKSLFQIQDEDDDNEFEDENNSLISSLCYGKWKQFWTNLGFPLLAISPPFLIAIFVEDVQVLVSVTGSYAGVGIQYIIPVFLVYHARKCFSSSTSSHYAVGSNPYASPFKSQVWLYFVLAWSFVSIAFVTLNHIFK